MAYIEIKTISGCKYRYERVSVRIGDKVNHTSRYLGPVASINKKRRLNTGRKPKLRTKELSLEDKALVNKSIKHSKSFVKDRAKIIQLSSEGNTIKQNAKN